MTLLGPSACSQRAWGGVLLFTQDTSLSNVGAMVGRWGTTKLQVCHSVSSPSRSGTLASPILE